MRSARSSEPRAAPRWRARRAPEDGYVGSCSLLAAAAKPRSMADGSADLIKRLVPSEPSRAMTSGIAEIQAARVAREDRFAAALGLSGRQLAARDELAEHLAERRARTRRAERDLLGQTGRVAGGLQAMHRADGECAAPGLEQGRVPERRDAGRDVERDVGVDRGQERAFTHIRPG